MSWDVIPLIAVLLAFGYYVNDTHTRLKKLQNQVARQSLAFRKIENDIAFLDRAVRLAALVDDKEELSRNLEANFNETRIKAFRLIVEEGLDGRDAMRGLQEPDIDDDPAFWREGRMKRFGFETDDEDKVV